MKGNKRLTKYICFFSVFFLVVVCALLTSINLFAEGYNPYSGGWSNCTWGAWQLAYNATGISLPNFGNAVNWYGRAASMGYSVGTTPRANSIAVWSGGLGHVGFVSAVGENGEIYVQEGNFAGGYHEQWWSSGYRDLKPFVGYIYLETPYQEETAYVVEENVVYEEYNAQLQVNEELPSNETDETPVMLTTATDEVVSVEGEITETVEEVQPQTSSPEEIRAAEEARKRAEEEQKRLEEEKKQKEIEEKERAQEQKRITDMLNEEAETVIVVVDAVTEEEQSQKSEELESKKDVMEEDAQRVVISIE